MNLRPLIPTLVAVMLACSSCGAELDRDQLANALMNKDPEAIRTAVAAMRMSLGQGAGEPEAADEYRAPAPDATRFTPQEARRGFVPFFSRLDEMRWWTTDIDPTRMTAPLREPASVITGGVAAYRARLDQADRSLEMAKDAAEFLIWAQDQAGAGLYPFPAARGTSDARAMQVATRFLDRAERAGKLDEVMRNSWLVEDFGDGGLQFDNGVCGVAMLELHAATQDPRYIDSARRAADWAISRPLCPNWNYNAFSVDLLAKMYSVTGEEKYLQSAVEKATLGVVPGQLIDGPHAGRWIDPHNARPPYHYIMMRALAQLALVLPPDHRHRPEIVAALRRGLATRNAEMADRGVMNKDDATEALLLVSRVFAADHDFLRATRTSDALDALLRLVCQEARSGKAPLGPAAWGLAMEHLSKAQ